MTSSTQGSPSVCCGPNGGDRDPAQSPRYSPRFCRGLSWARLSWARPSSVRRDAAAHQAGQGPLCGRKTVPGNQVIIHALLVSSNRMKENMLSFFRSREGLGRLNDRKEPAMQKE